MRTSYTRTVFVITLLVAIMVCVMGASGENTVNTVTDTLIVEPEAKMDFYIVQSGDNLSNIAEKTNSSLGDIISSNRLSKTIIQPGQVLLIPGYSPDIKRAISRGFTREDVQFLARAIYAEARGETFIGQVAVGAVIINRLKSGKFPRTIREVVMQKNGGTFQFSPVKDGSINLDPDETAIYAAIRAIEGHDPTNGALYFYNPETASDRWIKTLPVMTRIGNHVFASKT